MAPASENLKPYPLLYLMALGLLLSLGCSIGSLVVRSGTPTPTPNKTPRPTYTYTPDWTATFTPSPTFTPSVTPTETPIPTTVPETAGEAAEPPAEEPAVEEAPPVPAEPPPTPTPAEPTATPTPSFPFKVVFYKHDTGSPGETRMTAWVRVDYEPGIYKTLAGFQMKAIAPDGNTYSSEISGSGAGDSTVMGTGDNHPMNTKLEFQPYTPGVYKVYLEEAGMQVSPEVEFELSVDPRQYIHFEFFKNE